MGLEENESQTGTKNEDGESAELVLFQVKECYVYMIPPRKSAASYRADEWNINKWDWDGSLKVISKGEDCTIRLEDKATGELYAQAPVREDLPLPVEAVIDSSRFFVLRIEDTSGSKHGRHAFIGLGFRERPQAYDFQAALFDHVKYLNKKKEAQEMEQVYQSRPAADYSLKEGETLRLQIKAASKTSAEGISSTVPKQGQFMRQVSGGNALPILVPPPPAPPASPLSPACFKDWERSKSNVYCGGKKMEFSNVNDQVSSQAVEADLNDIGDEDFGEFQEA